MGFVIPAAPKKLRNDETAACISLIEQRRLLLASHARPLPQTRLARLEARLCQAIGVDTSTLSARLHQGRSAQIEATQLLADLMAQSKFDLSSADHELTIRLSRTSVRRILGTQTCPPRKPRGMA